MPATTRIYHVAPNKRKLSNCQFEEVGSNSGRTTISSLRMASPAEPVIFNFQLHMFEAALQMKYFTISPHRQREGHEQAVFFSTGVVFKALGHHQLLATRRPNLPTNKIHQQFMAGRGPQSWHVPKLLRASNCHPPP